ncbi:hypothetical protein PROFUN_15509, partial [Planoprotostelium fungivorum]
VSEIQEGMKHALHKEISIDPVPVPVTAEFSISSKDYHFHFSEDDGEYRMTKSQIQLFIEPILKKTFYDGSYAILSPEKGIDICFKKKRRVAKRIFILCPLVHSRDPAAETMGWNVSRPSWSFVASSLESSLASSSLTLVSEIQEGMKHALHKEISIDPVPVPVTAEFSISSKDYHFHFSEDDGEYRMTKSQIQLFIEPILKKTFYDVCYPFSREGDRYLLQEEATGCQGEILVSGVQRFTSTDVSDFNK